MLEDALWLNQVLLVRVRETHDAPVVVVLPDDHDHHFDDNNDHDGDNNGHDHDLTGEDEGHHKHHQDLACLMCFSCTSCTDSSSKLHKRAK